VKTFTASEPLTDAEFDRLGDFLKSCKGGRAMNVEALDGFFAALIAGLIIGIRQPPCSSSFTNSAQPS
jgi:hypothetical protein